MANVRERIRMSAEEIDAFLAEPHKLQLATINEDGTPHLVTMYYALFDGLIGFWTYRTSRKARNLRRDPRLSCLVEAGDRYDELRGVMLNGTARAVDDHDEVLRVGTAVYGRSLGPAATELAPHLAQQARKRTAYLVEPTTVVSWDHRKLTTVEAG